MVSRQKIRVHESAYIQPLSSKTKVDEISSSFSKTEFNESFEEIVPGSDSTEKEMNLKPETDNNMVQSVKSLRNHK